MCKIGVIIMATLYGSRQCARSKTSRHGIWHTVGARFLFFPSPLPLKSSPGNRGNGDTPIRLICIPEVSVL